ncbi:MAG: pitrilysin family protein [Phycisphaerales bacterium]
MAFQRHTLDNGLTVLADTDGAAQTSAAGFFVRTGARDEASGVMGVSHFLEHMMFKGTADLDAHELNRRFDAIGARSNAYTSNEMTCFYTHVLPEALPEGLELLGRMMRPALRQSDFDTEKGVILEEIAMYQDNPFWRLYEATVERHFGPHPMGHRVLGTPETVTAMQRGEMQGYFDARYSADNTVVALAGKIDFDRCVAGIERMCGDWPRTRAVRDSTPPVLAGGALEVRSEKVNRAYVLAFMRAPAFEDDRRYAAALLSQVLGLPDNSRLHWSLIEPGIAEEAQASYDPHDGLGEFFVYASGEPGRLEEIWSIMDAQLKGLAGSLTQDDIDRLLPKIVTGTTLGAERPHDRMHRLGRLYTYLHRYWSLEEELEKVSRVTLKDLRDLCESFPMEPVTVGRLLPA